MSRARKSLSPELETKALELKEKLQMAFDEELLEIARTLVSKQDHEIFGETEFEVRDLLHQGGAKMFEEHLRQKKNGYVGSGVVCPGCKQTAEFQGYRRKQLMSILGPVCIHRGYYICHRCGHGLCPFDHTVGLTPNQLTPAAEELVSLAGLLCDSFEEAAEKALPKLSGIDLCESTVQRSAEDAGARLGTQLDQGKTLGGPKPWDWFADAEGKRCAYVSVDATGVRQQAKGGGPAEGRMPYVGMIFNPVPDLPKDSPFAPPTKAEMTARYIAGLYSLDDLGQILRKQGGQVGMNKADRWIALSDGGNGLEAFLRKQFPRVEAVIIDFWHVSDHLGDLARAWHPQDEEQAKEIKGQWCHVLKHEGGAKMITLLEALELPARRPALRKTYDEVLQYLKNHVDRMDYPTYQSKGWQIGSGAVESACKTVVGQRLKLAGMRWREPGTDNVCHLRALFKSERGQWQAFWQRQYARLNFCSTN